MEKKSDGHLNDAVAYNSQGIDYFMQDKLPESIRAFQRAIDARPDYLEAYYNIGLSYRKSRCWPQAINAYQALVSLAPKHAGAHFQLGCLLMQTARYQEAIEHFLLIGPDEIFYFETQANFATCLLKMGHLKQAKDCYLKALKQNPDDLQVLFNLGVIHMHQGLMKEAIEFYLRAITMNPDYFDAQNNLGVAFLAMQDKLSALKHFREALRIQPSNGAIAHTVSILTQENVSSSPEEYIRSLFDSYADHYDSHLMGALDYQVPKSMCHMLQTLLEVSDKKLDMIDLGCGTGLCGEYVKPLTRSMIGVDLSEKMIAVAAKKNIYNELIVSDIVSYLKTKEAQFDLAIAGDVVVYFGDLEAVFSSVGQALRDRGWFIFNVETGSDEPYHVTASGRFAHHGQYIQTLAARHQLSVMRCETVLFRTQNQEPVSGCMYLLQKQYDKF